MMVNPRQLLAAAKVIVARPDAVRSTLWPRAATLLARQALEARVRAEWREGELPMADRSMTHQFHVLTQLRDAETAGRAHQTWAELSHACHYHPVDLSPTSGELTAWIDTVDQLVRADWSRAQNQRASAP
jgi:hypothetical protein